MNERSDGQGPLVFLDTNVILDYLRGDASAAKLFSTEAKVRFAVNAIVLQELLLSADGADRPEFEHIRDQLRVLPINIAKAEAMLPKVRSLRNGFGHSNNILTLSSADECDFFVTEDVSLRNLMTTDRPQIVTPEEFITHLQAA